jgi:hypothetical protein
VNILEVIYIDTPWKKTGMDWDDIPNEIIRADKTGTYNEKPLAGGQADTLKAKLDAWRKANPRGTPEQAWTALGGQGPAPQPEKQMPGRDLRVEPPDETGNWIDIGNAWQSKSLPIEYAIKPNPKKSTTWGKNWIPAEQVIGDIRDEAKKNKKPVSDAEINKRLKDMPKKNGTPGRMYSDREIEDAWKTVKHKDVFTGLENPPDPGEQKKDDDKKDDKGPPKPVKGSDGTFTCQEPFVYDEQTKSCIKKAEQKKDDDKGPPKPVKGSDGTFTCPDPFVYDEKTKSCIKKAETPVVVAPVPVPAPNTETPPEPIIDTKTGGFKCKDPWVYDEKTKSCVKKAEPPKPSGEVILQWPSGSESDLNKNNPYNGDGHKGIDIAVSPGILVVAPEDGKITKLPVEDSKGNVQFDNRGLFIEFTSRDEKRVHKFFHLSVIGEASIMGASFSKGKALAKSGGKQGTYGAGNAKGAGHLHWEVWVEGKSVNPMSFFKKNGE